MSKGHLCNYQYDNELNIQINKRHFPSSDLQPNFDPRPLSTKYTELTYPLDNKTIPTDSQPLRTYEYYSTQKVFFPGNSKAPVGHFLDNIDVESTLKNQFQTLTKNDGPNYIPHKKSDLFLDTKYENIKEANYYKLPYKVRGTNNKKCNLAPKTFHNHTKNNVKNL